MGDFSRVIKNLKNYISAMSHICDNAVYVGVPQKNSTRKGNQPTNAELMFIHTNGSPVMNIPPRPVIEPAIEAYQKEINEKLLKAFNAYKRSEEAGDVELEKVGIYASDRCRRWFVDPRNGWAPNAPITLEGGWMRNPVNGAPIHVKGKGENKQNPLINTGVLRRSITYVIDKE